MERKTRFLINFATSVSLAFLLAGCGSVPSVDESSVNTFSDKKGGQKAPKTLVVEAPEVEITELYMGMFPQSLKKADVSVSNVPDESGYYAGSDGASYVKVDAANPKDGLFFSDGQTPVDKGRSYYFKVEPVLWNVIYTDSKSEKLVLSAKILDASSYKNSEAFLKNFYEKSFSSDEKGKISGDVKILSLEDLKNPDYIFSRDGKNLRSASVSDYARARGAYVSKMRRYEDKGWWWLSTPAVSIKDGMNYVSYYGREGYEGDSSDSSIGILPAMHVK